MSLRKHWNIFKLKEKTIILGVLVTGLITSAENEAAIKEDISNFQRADYRVELLVVCLV